MLTKTRQTAALALLVASTLSSVATSRGDHPGNSWDLSDAAEGPVLVLDDEMPQTTVELAVTAPPVLFPAGGYTDGQLSVFGDFEHNADPLYRPLVHIEVEMWTEQGWILMNEDLQQWSSQYGGYLDATAYNVWNDCLPEEACQRNFRIHFTRLAEAGSVEISWTAEARIDMNGAPVPERYPEMTFDFRPEQEL